MPKAVRGQLNMLDMELKDLAKEQLEKINELKDAYEKYRRGEIDRKELDEILDNNETYVRDCDKLIAGLEEHLNKLSAEEI